MKTTRRPTIIRRRGVLLLLVLSALTMFMMLGALMLVLATRARTSARAFATASNTLSRDDSRSRSALDEALMTLLRGSVAAGPVTESILADRYGSAVTMGPLTNVTRVNAGLLRAQLTGVAAATPLALNGRVLTIKPPASDPAPISSYRILSYSGNTVELANLRTSMPFRTLPAATSACMAIINGRDFDNSAGNEAWDEPGAANPFLTEARLQDADIQVTRPAFQRDPTVALLPVEVDNDGDGMVDGVWLNDAIPKQVLESGTVSYRVSYLVLDMDGRFNVNAHGLRSGASDNAVGPASVDGSTALGTAVWNRLLGGGTIPPASPPSPQQRRPTPALGYDVDGRFGTMGNGVTQYDLRLDFDGPRPGSPSLAGERVGCGNLASLFTAGELERLMRPFDTDTAALPPRLASILGDDAQKARMRVTTDSWDTTGLVGQAASKVATAASSTGLPQSVIEGRRFDINTSMANVANYADFLFNVVVAAGVNHEKTRQWVANVVDYRDKDTQPTTVTISGTSVTGHEAQYGSVGGDSANESFTSIGQLLCVPRGSKSELDDPACLPELKRSLAVDFPEILDAVMVTSPFAMTVAANPWREPGRVNVNTCDEDVWKAVVDANVANPYAPAQSAGDILTNLALVFSNPERPYNSVNVARANRLANIATTRSNVFAVWVTVEITDSAAPDQKTFRRAFAIVDRSIPVGYCPGVNLNARDTLRLVRYLE